MNEDAQELLAAVRARTEGTPYVVTETGAGFDVKIDIENASWYALMYKQHLSKTWIYHVKLSGDKTLAITDDVFTVKWRAGAETGGGVPKPMLAVGASRELGRIEEKSFQKTWGVSEQGQYDKVVDYSFTSSEGRDLIRGPAQELGWTEQRGGAERVGMYVAIATIALLVLAGIVVGIVALTGGL